MSTLISVEGDISLLSPTLRAGGNRLGRNQRFRFGMAKPVLGGLKGIDDLHSGFSARLG
jgi:hypothetical protein